MDKRTKGAWLLAQSKSLDAVTGPGAARLENISYAGRVGRLYNLLRRNLIDVPSPTIEKETVARVCQLNGIDRPTRELGLAKLQEAGRIDVAQNGAVAVLGATTATVLEATAQFFDEADPSQEEHAVLQLSEKISDRPLLRADAQEFIGDLYKIKTASAAHLIDLCKSTAIIDEEFDKDRAILFNSNTFRDGQYARKAMLVLDGLNADQKLSLTEVQEKLSKSGALYESDVIEIVGSDLYKRLVSVGYFDRMEVSNSSESVGYIVSPNDFQRFGRPFQDDPIDDAKALLASLTYGRTRSSYLRGSITMPDDLLRALIMGREIGKNGVRAIGEDYKELERRQVVQVTEKSYGRYTMKLLKRDVGELALSIIRGKNAAQEAVLIDGSAASSFKGPHDSRIETRTTNDALDKKFVADALDRLRTGG